MGKIRIPALLLTAWLAISAFPAVAAMQSKPVQWKVGKQTYSGFVVYDDASRENRPGLLMVPDWMGVTPAAVEKAKQVAGEDYVVLVVDMYGKGVRPKNATQAQALVAKQYADRAGMRTRASVALQTLKAQEGKAPLDTSRIGAFGYCFGGATVLELARAGANLAGVVSFHGGLDTSLPARPGAIKAPLLILNGADDQSVAPHIAGFQQEMNEAGADWQFVNFSGAVHCFALETANSPPGCVYNERAARRAYRMMDGFLDEVFGE